MQSTAALCRGDVARADARSPQAWESAVCPAGTTPDRSRTRAELAWLRSQSQGNRLLAALKSPAMVCYGDVPEGILHSDGVLVLRRDRSRVANAARIGHLLHHVLHGLPLDDTTVRTSTLTCTELVTRVQPARNGVGSPAFRGRCGWGAAIGGHGRPRSRAKARDRA